MKRYLKASSSESTTHRIEVVFEVGYKDAESVAAATYRGYNVPEGPLLPAEKDAIIDSQVYQDYQDFIESVEDLCTDYYDLEIYYKNKSQDNSFYWGMLAKNSDESLILDFDFTLRVSNHDSHRSEQSQKHKAEKKAKLAEIAKGKKTRPITRSIVVNQDKFSSWMEAYEAICDLVEGVVATMTRRKK